MRRWSRLEEPDVTTIKASCPHCGDVELVPAQVSLVICTVPHWSYYTFSCARCQHEVHKSAEPDVVQLLLSGGVRAETWVVPAEVLETHDGPPLGYDDVLDFALWLDTADLLAAAAAVHRHGRHRATPETAS
jgi:predicted nucleic-acid-binding Zn-ribbon protein